MNFKLFSNRFFKTWQWSSRKSCCLSQKYEAIKYSKYYLSTRWVSTFCSQTTRSVPARIPRDQGLWQTCLHPGLQCCLGQDWHGMHSCSLLDYVRTYLKALLIDAAHENYENSKRSDILSSSSESKDEIRSDKCPRGLPSNLNLPSAVSRSCHRLAAD